ncbi:MAG: crotonyl-CoA carboxylase/reductase [Spirochaetaceae bacterium]|nr:crotonyl-CoA carboxylase/reductase [Spirochaetaceae bacterium]|tara:strand:- start:21975 stop:23180 length:1206 start_codon:yes stop_codon:yes gene_type:complete
MNSLAKPPALGVLPAPGPVPERMHAQVIRRERYGDPAAAFQMEEVPVPLPGPDEVLVAVKRAGLNYNNVWAALGHPVDVISMRMKQGASEDFHIGGSDAAGIVYATGDRVKDFHPGDEVVVSPARWDAEDPYIQAGGDPSMAPSLRAWGYETNWGSFAQFCLVKSWQLYPRLQSLNWDQSAVYLLCGATAVRMLLHWSPNTVESGMPVLIWGGAGGVGSMAVQIVRSVGGLPVAVVNSQEKRTLVESLGAKVINRSEFPVPGLREVAEERGWTVKAEAFREELLRLTGGILPEIVVEHPGQNTIPLSQFCCAPGGMIVICAGTTGYMAQLNGYSFGSGSQRLQGSHFASREEIETLHQMIEEGRVAPHLGAVHSFEEIGAVHGKMRRNEHPPGNTAFIIAD